MSACRECGFTLTFTEARFYMHRCEKCERAWSDRVEAWRKGGEDAELSRMFPNETRTLQ